MYEENEKTMNLAELKTFADQGARWIVENQREDGLLPSRQLIVESCYKGIWALTVSGYAHAASRLADAVKFWIDEHGDIPQPRQKPDFFTTHYLYGNTYNTIGAQVLGRFDVSSQLFGFIQSRQDEATGGFYSQGPQYDGELCMDTVSTSIAGLTCLYMNDVDRARRAGDFLAHVMEAQPELDRAFYTTWKVSGAFRTDWSEQEPHVRIDISDAEQDWYFIGIAVMFLPHLYEATGQESYLHLGQRYLDYIDQACCEGALTDFSSGKSGVGAAHLCRLTGKPRYREIATNIAKFILDHQHESGCWLEEPTKSDCSPTEVECSDMDMTAEYVLWLHQICRHLKAA